MLTGSRRNEVLAAKWEDIDLAKSAWSRPTRKTTPDRVPLNEAAVAVLHDLRHLTGRSAGDVFSLTLEGRITALKRVWRSIRRQAGISMRLHDLRHNFASVLASRKVPILVLSKLLGHASITTTQRYAHLFDEALREGIEKVVR
jgi:integrase